jgi:hypothetical protein
VRRPASEMERMELEAPAAPPTDAQRCAWAQGELRQALRGITDGTRIEKPSDVERATLQLQVNGARFDIAQTNVRAACGR